ncbi:MAG: ECF-type sigma factor [Myxococcota bacterium]
MAEPDRAEQLQVKTDFDAKEFSAGSPTDVLVGSLYGELRRLAAKHLSRERDDHTWQTTELLHEVYLRLFGQDRTIWESPAHFFAVASRLMRRILVDHARTRCAQKRGSGQAPIAWHQDLVAIDENEASQILAVHDALKRLEGVDEVHAEIVLLQFFGGLSQAEIAEALGVSVPTVRRRWRFARAWLTRELSSDL